MIRFLKNLFHLGIAGVATAFYGFPAKSLTVIGITGTSGKTTTAHLIYGILALAGEKVSIISSVNAIINGKTYDTGFHVTTPNPIQLQRFMREATNGGSKYIIIEMTSHAIDQYRVWGTSVDIALVTNITHEHLDYHKTFDKYKEIKAKILARAKYCILNKDDPTFNFLKKKSNGEIWTFSIDGQADVTASTISLKSGLLGRFNLANCLAAATVGKILKIDEEIISKAISGFLGVPGRMEEVKNPNNMRIIIDFAHKPDALLAALEAAREITEKKLIVVFGCAGGRDKLKRPMMGEIAAQNADFTVLTAEDPRTEDVRKIIDEIARGCLKEKIKEADRVDKEPKILKNGMKYFWRIPDRQEAINFAVRKLASSGDLVLICGKGHEKSMCWGNIEHPWDEFKAVRKALYGTVKTS